MNGETMPPVNPRVSTVLSEEEVEKLKAIAEKYDLTVAWLLRAAINHVLVKSEQESDRFVKWLHEARA